jgi:cobalt/nickel transport system permease protein
MLYLDYLSYHNRFSHISILEKLAVGLGGLLLAISSGSPVVNLAVFLFMSALLWRAGMPFGYWLRLWGTLLPFLLTAVATILFSFSFESFPALWSVRLGSVYVGVTGAGRQAMEAALLRSVAAAACLLMLAGTTPVSYLVAWASQVVFLRPVLEVALLAYRFIFVILHTAAQIYTAQQSRLGYSSLSRSLRSIGILAANLGRKSFITARDLFIGLSSRNYTERLVFRYPPQHVAPVRITLIMAIYGLVLWGSH